MTGAAVEAHDGGSTTIDEFDYAEASMGSFARDGCPTILTRCRWAAFVAQVPDVLGKRPRSWAMPCVRRQAFRRDGFFVPPIGSQVWMEFRTGQSGLSDLTERGLLGSGHRHSPMLALAPPPVVSVGGTEHRVTTSGQNTLVISGRQRQRRRRWNHSAEFQGATLIVNDSGIYLSAGPGMATISLTGTVVAINDTALTINDRSAGLSRRFQ